MFLLCKNRFFVTDVLLAIKPKMKIKLKYMLKEELNYIAWQQIAYNEANTKTKPLTMRITSFA